MKRLIILTVAGLIIPLFVTGQSVKRVLFIGNSYVYFNNMPGILSDIAKSAGDSVICESSTPGGYTLMEHSANPGTLSKIKTGLWDFVVLQEQSLLTAYPEDSVDTEVIPYAHFLDSLIHVHNRRCKTMFYMTWGRKNGDAAGCKWWPPLCTFSSMDSLVEMRYMRLAEINHGSVSPVGAVWKYIRESYPEIELYFMDGSHPSPVGSYAAACCFYTSFFRKSPFSIRYDYKLPAAEAKKIRIAVKEVVFENLKRWEK